MRIDSVAPSPDRAGRFLVRFSDGSVLRLYRATVEDFGVRAGLELSDEQLARLRDAAGQMSAKMRAVRIVSAGAVSEEDLRRRLVYKGETPEQAREAVEWMASLSLVDDRLTAKQIVERCASRGYGVARAKQALYEKQIPRQYWDEALADYPDQQEAIAAFLASRLNAQSDRGEIRRATDALLRRGHSYGEIRRALRRLYPDESSEE